MRLTGSRDYEECRASAVTYGYAGSDGPIFTALMAAITEGVAIGFTTPLGKIEPAVSYWQTKVPQFCCLALFKLLGAHKCRRLTGVRWLMRCSHPQHLHTGEAQVRNLFLSRAALHRLCFLLDTTRRRKVSTHRRGSSNKLQDGDPARPKSTDICRLVKHMFAA